ncbi:MAG: hypothetical protein ACTSWN_10735 [Promethearchaeota archaeon]
MKKLRDHQLDFFHEDYEIQDITRANETTIPNRIFFTGVIKEKV